MKIATSRITQQGQVSIPAEVRKRLGLFPGTVIEWNAEGESIVVRKAGKFTSADIHNAIFGGDAPSRVSLDEMDAAIAAQVVEKHARG